MKVTEPVLTPNRITLVILVLTYGTLVLLLRAVFNHQAN